MNSPEKSEATAATATHHRLYGMCTAALSWFAVLLQLYLTTSHSIADGAGAAHGIWLCLAFFTVLTNILVAISASAVLAAADSRWGRIFRQSGTITGIAINIIVVGITYNLILRGIWQPRGWQRVADEMLHVVVPVVYVGYWWVFTARRRVYLREVATWAIYPVAYFMYALVRGAITRFYPYPFLNVVDIGYARVLLNALGVLALFAAIAAILVSVNRLRGASAVAVNPSPRA